MVATRARLVAGLLAAMLAAPAFVLGVQAASGLSDGPSEAVEEFKVRLIEIQAKYEREAWKNNPDFYIHGPVNGFSNGSGRFDTAVGYHVILRVGLTDTQGKPITGGQDIMNVELAASIDTSQGARQAYIVRQTTTTAAPIVGQQTSTSPEFFLHLDMDGSNTAPAGQRSPMAFDAGSKIVHVTINRRGVTGTVERVGSNDLLFAYDSPGQSVSVGNLTAPYTSRVPDTIFRGFTDVGRDKRILFVREPVPTSSQVVATYEFGRANATIRWVIHAAHQGCEAPSGPTAPACGAAVFYDKVLKTGTTDALGTVSFQASAKELLQFPTRTFGAAVVVVAAALDPDDPGTTSLGPEYAAGSPSLLTGAIEFAIPIADRTARVSKYSIDTSAYDAIANSTAPDAAKVGTLKQNSLEVQFYDDGQGSVQGDAYAVLDGRDAALATAKIASHSDPGFPNYRVARLPVGGIIDSQTSHYTVLGFLYGQNSELYTLARGDRGYVATYSLPTSYVGSQGNALINLTSVNTNYDGAANEPGFELPVVLRVNVPGLPSHNTVLRLKLPEGGTLSQPFRITSAKVGDVRVLFNGTTGDTLRETPEVMPFVMPPPKKTFADRIPGFDGLFAVLAVAAVGAALARRGRNGEGF
ncbi:MAG: hypothetical protein HYT80_06515 [Euryarchaeota archaeon]|nr:hypothetical protein [Euryarchaeota archaeon]